MTRKGIDMPNLNEIFRLKHEGFSNRGIDRSTGVARSTILKYLECAHPAGLSVAQTSALPPNELEQLLFPKFIRGVELYLVFNVRFTVVAFQEEEEDHNCIHPSHRSLPICPGNPL